MADEPASRDLLEKVTRERAGITDEHRPEAVAARARESQADFVAVSTYSGIALRYLTELRQAMDRLGCDAPLFIGGKLNEVPDASASGLASVSVMS